MTDSNSQNSTETLERQLALLKALADKPLVLPPVFVDITGSHTAGLLLQQGVYWTKKNLEKDPASDGWFFISLPKLQEQLRMGEHCLRDARGVLKEKGFMESKRAGIPPRLFFRVDLLKVLEAVNLQLRQNGRIDSAFPQKSQNGKNTPPKPPNNPDETPGLVPPKRQNPNKEEETKGSETKKETNQEREASPPVENKRLSQSERDSWDLRRWRKQMELFEGEATVGSESSAEDWLHHARIAAYRAGVTIERLQQLLKQNFPGDPLIDRLAPQKPLFTEQSA